MNDIHLRDRQQSRLLEDGHANHPGSNSNSPDSGKLDEKDQDERVRFTWGQWIVERFNFSYFTCTQSTGGLALALSECPKQFSGLQTIGVIVFILNLVLFLALLYFNVTSLDYQPIVIQKVSHTTVPECFFYGAFWLTIATTILGINRYGVPKCGPWFIVAVRVLFWIYAAATLLSICIHIIVVYEDTPIRSIHMNPAW